MMADGFIWEYGKERTLKFKKSVLLADRRNHSKNTPKVKTMGLIVLELKLW